MLAANIWHWWIGVGLTAIGVLAVAGLGVGYLKNITAQKYPPDGSNGRRRARENDL